MDVAKLTETVKTALAEAKAVRAATEDGGTCNFDSTLLCVTRKSKKVEAALEAAGANAFYHKARWNRGYIISPNVGAQGAARTKAAEKVTEVLKAAGFECRTWYQVD